MKVDTKKLETITGVRVEPEYRVRLTFGDGFTGVVDMATVIRPAGVFAPLGDPDVFGQVRIGSRGRWIEWPGEVDLCADALRLEAEKS